MAGTAGREPGAHSEAGANAHALRHREDQLQLCRLLHHQDHLGPEPRGHQGSLDVLLVLVAVADDQGFFVVQQGHDRQQLGLRSRFEAVMVRPAVGHDVLRQVAVLIDLDRVDSPVLGLVLVLCDRLMKGTVDLLQPGADQVGETNQERCRDSSFRDLFDQVFDVDGALASADGQMATVVDREEIAAPALDPVEIGRILGRPPFTETCSMHALSSKGFGYSFWRIRGGSGRRWGSGIWHHGRADRPTEPRDSTMYRTPRARRRASNLCYSWKLYGQLSPRPKRLPCSPQDPSRRCVSGRGRRCLTTP